MIKTGLEIVEMIARDEAPKKIKYCSDNNIWYFNKYLNTYNDALRNLSLLTNLNTEFEIIEETILTDKEKEYLSYVIKPFRDEIRYIKKSCDIEGCEYLYIIFIDDDRMTFKSFEKNKYYKNMKLDNPYALIELGL